MIFFSKEMTLVGAILAITLGTTITQGQEEFSKVNYRPISQASSASHWTPVSTQQDKVGDRTGQPRRSPLYPAQQTSSRLPTVDPLVRAAPSQPQDIQDTPPGYADSPSTIDRDRSEIEIPYGSVALIDDITLPALEAGAIKFINVEEGQFIPAGTVVGQIDEALLVQELEQAKIRYENARKVAMSDVSVRAAGKEYDLRNSEYETAQRLYRTKSRSKAELDQARFQAEIALLKQERAKLDGDSAMGEAKLELARLDQVKYRIGRHTLKSNYNAYVVEIFKKPQEFVNVGDDVMRLGRMDRLWVQGNINSSQLEVHEALYRPVTVTATFAGGKQESFEGRVDQIPIEMQGSDQFQIKIRVDNRKVGGSWLLRPLQRVSIKVHLDRGFIKDQPVTNEAGGLLLNQPIPLQGQLQANPVKR